MGGLERKKGNWRRIEPELRRRNWNQRLGLNSAPSSYGVYTHSIAPKTFRFVVILKTPNKSSGLDPNPLLYSLPLSLNSSDSDSFFSSSSPSIQILFPFWVRLYIKICFIHSFVCFFVCFSTVNTVEDKMQSNSSDSQPQEPNQRHHQPWIPMQYPPPAMVMPHHMMTPPLPPPYMHYHHHYQHHHLPIQHSQPLPGSGGENKTIWVGDLHHWMDESYLNSCFSSIGEV